MDTVLPLDEIALRLVAALLLGGVIGWQREAKEKPAGLKTHMIVSLGSASFTIVMLELLHDLAGDHENVRLDPSRVLQGIVGGIGFLGAGAIIQSRGAVQGLTTAATIWAVGAVGLACGLGSYALGAISALLVVAVLVVVGFVEARFVRRGRE